ncbi:MAG: AEC family transporter [Oscillospiraceae bacterium]|nr:AEC family transporter [Oscillospiraceae bacterium]
MGLSLTILNQAVIMLILIIAGIICYKIKMITVRGTKEMSSIILQVVNPVVIFLAYQRDFETALLSGLVKCVFLSALAFAAALILSYLLVRGKEGSDKNIERFACVYSNCGFMGIPLVNAMLGLEGVFYLTAFVTVFNLLVWTHGVMQMSGVKSMKSLVCAVRSPAVIAIFAGLATFILRAFVSQGVSDMLTDNIIMKALGYIAELNTPLAMIVAGASIAQINIIGALKKPRIYYIAFLRLLLIPCIIAALLSLIKADFIQILTVTVAMSAPTATMVTLFAIRYEKDYLYASEIFAFTTIISVATMPLIVALSNFLNQG